MPKEPSTRILIHDKLGRQRKLLSIKFQQKPHNNSVIFFMPSNIIEVGLYDELDSEGRRQAIRNVHHVHLSYHETGYISFAFYDSKGKKMRESKGKLTLNLPLSELSPGRCFLRVSPYELERFPEEKERKRPTDVDIIQDSALQEKYQICDIFRTKPFHLYFWIGHGEETTIMDKMAAIKWFHIGQSLFYSEVHGLQEDQKNFQIFVAMVSPKDLVEYPDKIGIRIYTQHESGFLSPKTK